MQIFVGNKLEPGPNLIEQMAGSLCTRMKELNISKFQTSGTAGGTVTCEAKDKYSVGRPSVGEIQNLQNGFSLANGDVGMECYMRDGMMEGVNDEHNGVTNPEMASGSSVNTEMCTNGVLEQRTVNSKPGYLSGKNEKLENLEHLSENGRRMSAGGTFEFDILSKQEEGPGETVGRQKLKEDILRRKKQESIRLSQMALQERYQPIARECSVLSCLHQFTTAELLTGNNRFGCNQCTRKKAKHNDRGTVGCFPYWPVGGAELAAIFHLLPC